MLVPTYSVVAYLSGPIADFVSDLRRRLNPLYGDWLAHVSVLSPRKLLRTIKEGDERLARLQQVCSQTPPFEVSLAGVATFWPINGVVYLSVAEGCAQLMELHNLLNEDGMYSPETYGYVPHVTIAQALDEAATQHALKEVAQAWTQIPQPVRFRVESLVLVEEKAMGQDSPVQWLDIAAIPLQTYSLSSSY